MNNNSIDKQLDEIYLKAYDLAGYKNKVYNPNKNKTLIGKFYEDVVRTVIIAINKYYPNLTLSAPTGYTYANEINNEKGAYEQSNQTDILVTIAYKDKINLTSTDDGLHIKDVAAVIEVKKNFKNKNTFAESIWNITSINKFIDFCELMNSTNINNKDLIMHNGINCEIKLDGKTPSIIVFGFDGCENEETLREHFRELYTGKLEYRKSKQKIESLKLEHLYEYPDLIIDDNSAIIKMTGLITAHSDGLVPLFSSCGTLNTELKIYIFKLTILYAIIKYLKNPEMSNEIYNNTTFKLFITNPLVGINLNDDTNFICSDKYLFSPYCEIDTSIELTEAESELYHKIDLGYSIETNKVPKETINKLLSSKILFEENGILKINRNSIIIEKNNRLTINLLKQKIIQNE